MLFLSMLNRTCNDYNDCGYYDYDYGNYENYEYLKAIPKDDPTVKILRNFWRSTSIRFVKLNFAKNDFAQKKFFSIHQTDTYKDFYKD